MFFVLPHPEQDNGSGRLSQPSFREDARWNAERRPWSSGVGIGEYRGVDRVPRRVFQRLLPEWLHPERCVEGHYLQRTLFGSIAEWKFRRRRQLAEDGNVEISGRDPCQLPIADVCRASPNRRSRPFSVIQLRIRNGSSCLISVIRDHAREPPNRVGFRLFPSVVAC